MTPVKPLKTYTVFFAGFLWSELAGLIRGAIADSAKKFIRVRVVACPFTMSATGPCSKPAQRFPEYQLQLIDPLLEEGYAVWPLPKSSTVVGFSEGTRPIHLCFEAFTTLDRMKNTCNMFWSPFRLWHRLTALARVWRHEVQRTRQLCHLLRRGNAEVEPRQSDQRWRVQRKQASRQSELPRQGWWSYSSCIASVRTCLRWPIHIRVALR